MGSSGGKVSVMSVMSVTSVTSLTSPTGLGGTLTYRAGWDTMGSEPPEATQWQWSVNPDLTTSTPTIIIHNELLTRC